MILFKDLIWWKQMTAFFLFYSSPVPFLYLHTDRFTHFEACITQSLSSYRTDDILNPSKQLTPQCVR